MITALPSPPSTNDPSNFATKADALLAALPNFVTEANATAVAMNLNSTTDTSASSVAIGTGAKSFAVSTGKSFQPGMYLVIADTAAPSTNSMFGQITSYSTGTGALVMNILQVAGSGTKTAWVISQSAAAPTQVLPGYLFGMTMSTAGSSATMSISSGVASDSAGAQSMTLPAIAKTTSAWAVGTAAGGLDTGAIANSTWYHFYVIRRPDTGVVDVVFSTNATTPTLPANYTQYRYIGSGLTNGSAQWASFSQNGDEFLWLSSVLDANGVTPNSTTAQLLTISVPPGVKVNALLNATIGGGGTVNNQMLISSPDVTDAGVSLTGAPLWSGPTAYNIGNGSFAAPANVRTNTSAQIRYRLLVASAATTVYIATLGYINRRGRDA